MLSVERGISLALVANGSRDDSRAEFRLLEGIATRETRIGRAMPSLPGDESSGCNKIFPATYVLTSHRARARIKGSARAMKRAFAKMS